MKKFLTAMFLCGAFIFANNFAEAADNDLQIKSNQEQTQDLDFWSRLRDKVVFGDDDRDDRHHREPPRYRDDHRHGSPPPPPPHRDRGHRPPPPPHHRY